MANKRKTPPKELSTTREYPEMMQPLQAAQKAVEDGSNRKMIMAILQSRDIARSADLNDVDSLYDCLHRYIQYCYENNIKLGNMAVYSACGVSKQLIQEWASGLRRKTDPRYAEFAQYVMQICAEYREMLMSEGKLNPVTGIWWQKNYDGLSDSPTVIIATHDDAQRLSGQEIAEKYKYLAEQTENKKIGAGKKDDKEP